MAYNSQIHDSIAYFFYEMLFGNMETILEFEHLLTEDSNNYTTIVSKIS